MGEDGEDIVDVSEVIPQIITIEEPMAASLLQNLRTLDAQKTALDVRMQDAIAGYLAGKDMSTETYSVHLDLQTGLMRSTKR